MTCPPIPPASPDPDPLFAEASRLASAIFEAHIDARRDAFLVALISLIVAFARAYNLDRDLALQIVATCPLWDAPSPPSFAKEIAS